MIEAIGIGVFVFVTLVVAGWRALDLIERTKARLDAERREEIAARARRVHYSGPLVNRWGREAE